ncbi:MAG: PadR family transcriptional regulator [Actinomycetota bacterium]|nr:PadR family transcriptional regulator [Actinomycetota bacterium]
MEQDARDLTDFEQILLGRIARSPSSGYELKRFFATTPAVVYQPSSGALYPALRRIEGRGLLRAEQTPSAGKRTQRRYRVTASGQAAHARWLRQPVEPRTVGADLGIHLMRFVMAEQVLGTEEVLVFLEDLGAALEAFIADIAKYLATTAMSGRHPRLALRHGIEVHQASLAWVRSTIDVLRSGREVCSHDTAR